MSAGSRIVDPPRALLVGFRVVRTAAAAIPREAMNFGDVANNGFTIFRTDANARANGRLRSFGDRLKVEREMHVAIAGSVAVSDKRCGKVQLVILRALRKGLRQFGFPRLLCRCVDGLVALAVVLPCHCRNQAQRFRTDLFRRFGKREALGREPIRRRAATYPRRLSEATRIGHRCRPTSDVDHPSFSIWSVSRSRSSARIKPSALALLLPSAACRRTIRAGVRGVAPYGVASGCVELHCGKSIYRTAAAPGAAHTPALPRLATPRNR
jgi:hypothetical protein